MKVSKKKFFRSYPNVYADDANKIKKGLGAGLFARHNLKKGEVVFSVHGVEIVSFVPKNEYESSHWFPHAIGIAPYTWINPSIHEPLRYLNHSCNPNMTIKDNYHMVAIRNIQKEEQLTIDYSITEIDPRFKMPCICGEKNCRKLIGAIDTIPEFQFKKYEKYLSNTFRKYRVQGLPKPETYEVKYPRGKYGSITVRKPV